MPKKGGKKKASGDGAQSFDSKTMQEFKEAFGIMDVNKDGIIDKSDLKDIFAQLGQIPPDSQLQEMVEEADGPINFTMFLTLFGDRLTGTDPEDVIVGAFKMFDPKDTGFITENELRKILSHKKGDPFDDSEFEDMMKGKPPIKDGQVDYKAFAHLICTGAQEELNKE
jgi:Ca2+-binding EF-hand superfamily protein